MSRVLAIGDIHLPPVHPRYRQFCLDLYKEHRCNKVVFIGDVVDHHAVSFHAHHPECPGPDDEFKLAMDGIQGWYKAFPKATVLIGNHDARVIRLAEDNNIPKRYIRNYADTWNTPGWDWVLETDIDGVRYLHGTGRSGENPAFNLCKHLGCSVVMGHVHHAGGIKWRVSPKARVFGMDTGCGIDHEAAAFAYGRTSIRKPVLGAGVILEGDGYYHIMKMAPGEKYGKKPKGKK
ncbi:hypothetical protein LCGC14_0901770 [marine sediment metagenome]|uniref:Calcineurin-like phosphoesterase domain-containing protein n=1 Tax=marine sediment metagenome TaxID=412755 RepID=A0A0F9S331_9ZZZZ